MDPSIIKESLYLTPYTASPLLPLLLISLASQRHTPQTKNKLKKTYDYVIVGAGAAGSVVANRLTEMPCVRVLLLEAGPPPPLQTEIPAIARYFINTDIDWKFSTTPQRHTGAGLIDRKVIWPSGKTLGGSSSLNAMLYVRGNRLNYDEWEKLGAKGWSYDDVLPYFMKLENNTDPEYVASGFHGDKGPITATRPSFNPESKPVLMEAIRNEGFEFVNVNGAKQVGFFDHQGSIRDGQRCGTAKAYLVPSEKRKNLDIVTNAMVRKVLFRNKRAVGVEFDFNGKTQSVRANKEVILSAGTTNTAQILMLSGIGPMSELQRHDIPLIADLPVGHNLQDHQLCFLPFELDDRIRSFDDEIQRPSNIEEYINNKTGPLTSTEGITLMSYLSNPGSDNDDIPHHTVYFGDFASITFAQLGLRPEVLAKLILPLANKTLLLCASQLLHSHSIGSVTLESADPYDPPVIDPNYFADFRDIEETVQGLKTCMKIMQNPAMKKVGAKPVTTPVPGCENFITDNNLYLRCIVRTLLMTTNHQVGTARMGDPNDPLTVVDPELRVKGVERLRVVDASVMPTVPWSNTYIPTVMVAEKASDIIKKTIKCKKGKST